MEITIKRQQTEYEPACWKVAEETKWICAIEEESAFRDLENSRQEGQLLEQVPREDNSSRNRVADDLESATGSEPQPSATEETLPQNPLLLLQAHSKTKRQRRKRDVYLKDINKQVDILFTAKEQGDVMCRLNTEDEFAYLSFCDHCLVNIGVGEYWQCEICDHGTFLLCSKCYNIPDACCMEPTHRSAMVKQTSTDTRGNCPRALYPTTDEAVLCSRCAKACGTAFLHCCICEDGDFNMCFQCALNNEVCKKPWSVSGHPLSICTRYVER
ncbi:hypothetical protein K402DRAFT_83088 [Aulographum hederae CBS 113979]|uniref:Uncharacterized protein n=1 Tax=Aulographum hederae CBS 113979 TaxID=1176131 RepID=A0A6G1H051_9PEZI|nr:hypothetical protein K402DRAFT_83088 [Aulographum hederae CBS 113979]